MANRDVTHQAELEQLQKSAESMKNELQDGFQKQIDNKEASIMQIIEEHKLAMETRVKAEREAAERAAT